MGKDQELLEAARTGNVALVEKLLSGRKGGILGSGSGAIPLSSLLSPLVHSEYIPLSVQLYVQQVLLLQNHDLPLGESQRQYDRLALWKCLVPGPPLSWVVAESDKVSPQPPFLQTKQPQFPQLLLIRLTLHQLRCPSLDALQHLNVSLVVRGPKLNAVFEGDDHFPSPAGHTIFDTSQDAIGFLGHLGTLLAHVQAAVNQQSEVLFRRAAFKPLFPKPVALHGVVVAQVQDLALSLVEPHTIGPSPSIQPVRGALDPFVQIVDKDIKQDWPQHRALGDTTCDRPPTGLNSIHHHSLDLAIQPVLYPAKSTPVQAMSSQFLQENAVGNHVKGFTKV
ncbi:LOW QUALITY PROTEIN: hypothetical protein QYF61_008418 [Mycteria americana]|uniref:Uncharacterized protein n=1 Tax=Mycteria americana TaxID=33587 RepID=A0AAN7PG68_MYCAM|nr:LOW QUALITY PROTEIN: hypothetical protein QYF61_008418 [Mycteria americana]